jgi:glycine dehydrogenase subunit 2
VVFSEALAPFAPLPFVMEGDAAPGIRGDQKRRYHLIEEETASAEHHELSFGRMAAFHGQMGMFVRALSYIMSHGADGLRQVAEDAVLNANYILRELEDVMSAPFAHTGPCMHEALFDDSFLKDTGLSTLDLAKALIDEGFHPMTMYFPLVVHGAMLIEPTETEGRRRLDQFIGAMRALAQAVKAGERERFTSAPHFAPRSRLDETRAARQPVLTWQPPADDRLAAE